MHIQVTLYKLSMLYPSIHIHTCNMNEKRGLEIEKEERKEGNDAIIQ